MSLPDEQLRAQARAWELMTGPAKNWTRKNFYAATRHFMQPAQLEGLMNRAGMAQLELLLMKKELQR